MSIEGHYTMQQPSGWGNSCSQPENSQYFPVTSPHHTGSLNSPGSGDSWAYPASGVPYPQTGELPRVPPMYHPGLPADPAGYAPHPGLQQQQQQQPHHPHLAGQDGGFTWGKNLLDASNYMQQFGNHASTVARRNERERNRVRHINSTFENLRQHLPCSSKKKKLSKVDTLRTAIKYINHLQTILGTDMKPLTQHIKQDCTAGTTSSSSNSKSMSSSSTTSVSKRQSLDSSVTSNSSVENNHHEEEEELVDDDEGSCSRGSPASSIATSHTPLPYMDESHFQWTSS